VILVEILGERLRILRKSMKMSQVQLAGLLETSQASINRYETDNATPTPETLTRIADYFDVSLDYLFGRTEKPQGVNYEYRPKIELSGAEMKRFVEMCFDPQSPMNGRLKDTLLQMMEGVRE
jgi:transcriptional regulator with XRE-family HTH domain